MNYINTTTGQYPLSEGQLKALTPNTSYGPTFTPPDGYAYVFPCPQGDLVSQNHSRWQEDAPVLTDKGHYEQRWIEVDIFSEYTDAEGVVHTKAEQDEAYVAAIQAAAIVQARIAAKAQREIQVSQIKVTTAAGNEFDGDEVSQGRMARAIIALSTGLAPSVTWVLADNTTIQATPQELTEALVLAGQAQAAIWVI
jgi:hypothetical protein